MESVDELRGSILKHYRERVAATTVCMHVGIGTGEGVGGGEGSIRIFVRQKERYKMAP